MEPCRHEPGEVRHVAEQDAPTSSAISRKRSASTARGYAEPPQTISFGRCVLRQPQHLVVVDEARLAADAVVDERRTAARRS